MFRHPLQAGACGLILAGFVPATGAQELPTVRFFEDQGVTYREDLRTGQKTALPPRTAQAAQPTVGSYPPAQPVAGAYPPAGNSYPQPGVAAYPPAQPVAGAYPPAQPAAGAYPPAAYPQPAVTGRPVSYAPAAAYPAPTYPVPTAQPAPAAYPAPAASGSAMAYPQPYAAAAVTTGYPTAAPAQPAGRWVWVPVSAYETKTRVIGRWNPFRQPTVVNEQVPVLKYEWKFEPASGPAGSPQAQAVTAQRVIRY